MHKLYVLTETLTFYKEDKDGFPVLESFNCDIRGVFDDTHKLRELTAKLLGRTCVIIGIDNVTRESLTDIWYTTSEGLKAHLEYNMILIDKINIELPSFLSTEDES